MAGLAGGGTDVAPASGAPGAQGALVKGRAVEKDVSPIGWKPSWGVLMALVLAALGGTLPAASAAPKATIANDARLAGDAKRTRFIADLSRKVDVNVFALGDPYRVIVDLPDVAFQMPAGLGKEKRGLVTGYRYGLFAPGKSRVVIDVDGPFLIDKAFVLDAQPDQPARLVVDLVPTDRETFLAKLRETKSAPPSEGTVLSSRGRSAGRWHAGGDFGSRPWGRRSRHHECERHHGERGRARFRQDVESAARSRRAL